MQRIIIDDIIQLKSNKFKLPREMGISLESWLNKHKATVKIQG